MSSLTESIDQSVQIGIHGIDQSIVNDITREGMLNLSSKKSKVSWIETERSFAPAYIAHEAMGAFILSVQLIFF